MITLGINPICFLIAFAIIAVAPQLMSGVARAKMRAASLEAATPRRTSEDGEDRPTRERRSFAAASSPLLKGNDDYEKWEAPKRESRRHRPSASTTWRSSRRRRRRRRFNDDAKPSAAPSVAECEPLKVAAAADSGGGGGGAGEWIYDAAATAAHRQRGPGVSARLRCASEEHRALGNTRVVCQRTLRWMPAPSGYCVPPPQGCEALTPHDANVDRFVYSRTPGRDLRGDSPTSSLAATGIHHYPLGTRAMLVCPSRMDISSSADEADITICSPDGWIPAALGRCWRVCPLLLMPRGRVLYTDARGNELPTERNTLTNGTVASAICAPGTRLTPDGASGTAVCLDGGAWSGDIGEECKPLECEPLAAHRPANGDAGRLEYLSAKLEPVDPQISAITPGTLARLVCRAERTLLGAGESACTSRGEWTPEIGKCV